MSVVPNAARAKVRGIDVAVNCRNDRKHQSEVTDALKELKKQMKKAGLMQELRKREAFVAPSKKRRIKRDASIKQRRSDARRAERQHREEF